MSGSSRREQRGVVAFAKSLGWTAEEPNSKGYIKIKCACGKHQTWIHKTPSGVNYWAERRRFIERTCSEPPYQEDER